MNHRQFTCYGCGEKYCATNTLEERDAEKKANGFENLPNEDQVRVCDDCYDRLCETIPQLVKRSKP